MELGRAYSKVLPKSHRQALAEAADILIDTTLDDLAGSDVPPWTTDNWLIGTMLPPRYGPRYTPLFARKFLMCLITVVWKLGQPDEIRLSCVAEELATHILIQEAQNILRQRRRKADFSSLEDMLFEDLDFEFLYSGAYDGIEETGIGQAMGIANLAFSDWFKRFGTPGSTSCPEVHPYAEDEPDDTPSAR